MAELFETYEQEFIDLANKNSTDISSLKQSIPSEKQKNNDLEDSVNRNFKVLERTLENMEREMNAETNKTVKEQLRQRLKTFQVDLTKSKRELRQAKEALSKAELVGPENNATFGLSLTSDEGRQIMMNNTNILSQSDDTIMNMRKITAEMEDDASRTAEEISVQTNRIGNQIDRTETIGDKVQTARGIIGRMSRRQIITSIILIVVILILLLIIGIILFVVLKPFIDPYLPGNGGGSK